MPHWLLPHNMVTQARLKRDERHGVFKLLKERPFDVLVTVQGLSAEGQSVRRIEVYHCENGAVFNRAFEAAKPPYAADPEQLLTDAISCLLSHVKSRVHARQPFSAWFYTVEERGFIIKEAQRIFADHPGFGRAVAKLADVAKAGEGGGAEGAE